jgi:hypothetical protein
MITALVLVCSLTVTPDLRDCSRDNATQVLLVPEDFLLPSMCMMHGQSFLAETSVGQDLAANERVKIVCIRHVVAARTFP